MAVVHFEGGAVPLQEGRDGGKELFFPNRRATDNLLSLLDFVCFYLWQLTFLTTVCVTLEHRVVFFFKP